MTLDLTDDETRALAALLRGATNEEHDLLAPRPGQLKAILAWLDPPSSQPKPLPPLKPGLTPRRGGGQRRWGG